MPQNPLMKAYRKLRYGEPVIVVSGLPRSGTSMAMKMLAAGGLSTVTDGQRTADEDNPKGYYEDERVKDLAQMEDKSWLEGARGKAIKIISFLLRELAAGAQLPRCLHAAGHRGDPGVAEEDAGSAG